MATVTRIAGTPEIANPDELGCVEGGVILALGERPAAERWAFSVSARASTGDYELALRLNESAFGEPFVLRRLAQLDAAHVCSATRDVVREHVRRGPR